MDTSYFYNDSQILNLFNDSMKISNLKCSYFPPNPQQTCQIKLEIKSIPFDWCNRYQTNWCRAMPNFAQLNPTWKGDSNVNDYCV